MKLSLNLFAIAAFGFVGHTAIAQTETQPIGNTTETVAFGSNHNAGEANINKYWTLGTGLMYGLPLQSFDASYRNGLAWHLEVLSPTLLPKESPLHLKLGAHIDGMYSGRERVEITLQDPVGARADYGITNASIGGHFMARLTTKPAKIMPYLDGIIGGRWFVSVEDIALQEEQPDYESVVRENLSNDLTFIYGGSLGAMVRVNQFAYLDFRVTYSHGSRANHIDLSTLEGSSTDAVFFQEVNTKTPLLFTNVGVVFQLGGLPSYSGGSYTSNDSSRGNTPSGVFRPRRSNRNRNRDNNEYCAPSRSNRSTPKKPTIKRNPSTPKKPKAH